MTGSFLDELQEIRKRVLDDATLVLDVPFSGGKQAIRFRPVERARLDKVVAAHRVHGALDSDQALQLIVDCCDEIVRRVGDDLEPVDPDGGPLRFDAGDERWGSDVKTARDCVAKLYNLDVKPLAASGHAEVLVDWLQGVDAEIASRVEGESEGGVDFSETPPASTSPASTASAGSA